MAAVMAFTVRLFMAHSAPAAAAIFAHGLAAVAVSVGTGFLRYGLPGCWIGYPELSVVWRMLTRKGNQT